jgi:hypothetical protein
MVRREQSEGVYRWAALRQISSGKGILRLPMLHNEVNFVTACLKQLLK